MGHRRAGSGSVGHLGRDHAVYSLRWTVAVGRLPAGFGLRCRSGLADGADGTSADPVPGAGQQQHRGAVSLWDLDRVVSTVVDRGGNLLDRPLGAAWPDPVHAADGLPAGPRPQRAPDGVLWNTTWLSPGAEPSEAHLSTPDRQRSRRGL